MKKAIIVASFLLAIIILIAVLGNPLAKKYLSQKLEKINSETIEFTYDSLSVSLFNTSIFISGVSFNQNDDSSTIQIDQLSIRGISLWELIVNKSLRVNDVLIERPKYNRFLDLEKDNVPATKSSAQKEIPLNHVFFKRVTVKNGGYKEIGLASNQLFNINLIINGINSDLTKGFSKENLNYNSIEATIDSSIIALKKYHHTTTTKIELASDGTLTLSELRMNPIHRFLKGKDKPNHRVEWTELKIDSVHTKFNLKEIYHSNKVKINELAVFKLDYSSFNDKNYTKLEDKPTNLPQSFVKSLPFTLFIDSVKVIDSRIVYSERKKDAQEKGSVIFSKMNATLTNITNDSIHLQKDSIMRFDISTQLMGVSELKVNVELNLLSKNESHRIQGSLHDFELNKLNSVFRPLAFVEFKRGYLKSLVFDYTANKFSATGTTDFYYNDLKIIIYEQKKIFNPSFVGAIETTIANVFLIRKSNPLRGKYKEGVINYEREVRKSFLNFWWKSLFSGMQSTIIRGKK